MLDIVMEAANKKATVATRLCSDLSSFVTGP
jgi:hypothetical protein